MQTANVEPTISDNGVKPEKTRASLSSLVTLDFDAVIKEYCDAVDVDRSDLIRSSVARTLRDAGYSVDDAWLETQSREEAAKRAGATRSARSKELRKTASAADLFMKFLETSGNDALAAQFKSFLGAVES